jgi:hypothetical protein
VGIWTRPGGLFTITDIPACTYEVTACQLVRGRWKETGDTTVTVFS